MNKGQRRNVLATPPDAQQSAMWQQVLSQIASPERLEAQPPKKRKREWEKNNRPKNYRGVPREVREEVKAVAYELNVTVDEVARVFLEYGLHCVETGVLRLNGRPKIRRMTLYPFGGASWAENNWNPKPQPKRGRKAKEGEGLWREMAHYRLPDELHNQLKSLAEQTFPLGEVVTVLLKHGVESYRRGTLVLIPQPKNTASLGWKGEAN